MNQIQAKIIEPGALTPKETEVLALICEGKPDKLIARQLAISIRTVEHHCDHIYEKLQVRSNSVNARCAAIASAVARGMVLLSTRLLCLVLMLGSVDQDQSARVGRVRLPRVQVSRAREG